VIEQKYSRSAAGAGGVHHVAFRTPTLSISRWARRLTGIGSATAARSMLLFSQLYFRDRRPPVRDRPDGPVRPDEPMETLGENWRCRRSGAAPRRNRAG